MNKREVLILGQVLSNLDINATNIKWQYAVIKNKKLLESEIKLIQSLRKEVEQMKVYESERVATCVQHCEKDANNQPIIEENRYKVIDMDAFNKAMAELQEKYKEAFEEDGKIQAEFEKLLDEEVNIDLYKVKMEFVPNNLKSFEAEYLIDKMIVE